jgi:hypothetical protein
MFNVEKNLINQLIFQHLLQNFWKNACSLNAYEFSHVLDLDSQLLQSSGLEGTFSSRDDDPGNEVFGF